MRSLYGRRYKRSQPPRGGILDPPQNGCFPPGIISQTRKQADLRNSASPSEACPTASAVPWSARVDRIAGTLPAWGTTAVAVAYVNAPHQFHDASPIQLRMLCICAPAGQERFFMEVWSAGSHAYHASAQTGREKTGRIHRESDAPLPSTGRNCYGNCRGTGACYASPSSLRICS